MLRDGLTEILSSREVAGRCLAKRSVTEVWQIAIDGVYIPTGELQRAHREMKSGTIKGLGEASTSWYEFWASPLGDALWKKASHDRPSVTTEPPESGSTRSDREPAADGLLRLRETASSFLSQIPSDFSELSLQGQNCLDTLREVIATHLEPVVNQYANDQPRATWEEKRALASTVNENLQKLGLAIKCPETGNPAILIADRRSDSPEVTRFRLHVRKPGGGRAAKGVWRELPPLELMLDSGRVEPFAKWTQRLGDRGGRSKD
jgi:hypothetical protein